MSQRLKDNLNSYYFEAANKLTSKNARRRIAAYVESYDDIFFWRSVLTSFEDDTRYFEVLLPTRMNRLDRGKKAAMMRLLSESVGTDMIACVDADYDYLEQGSTAVSKEILKNPYILHTYAYAIENLQCYAPSLHNVCVAVTLNDHKIFDFEEYLKQYSLAIFPLFVWSIMYYRSPNYKDFTIVDFNRIVETGSFSVVNAASIIKHVRHKVGTKIRQLQKQNPDAKERYLATKEEIKQLGVSPENTYLYIQGHHLFDKVVVPMLKKVCDELRREREREITEQSVHSVQRRNELSCYNKSIESIESVLRKNIGYIQSEPFKHILKDVEKLLNRVQQKEMP